MPPAPELNRRDFLQRSAALAATSLLASRLSPHLHAGEPAEAFRSSWDRARDGIWLGPEYWANPLQDWQVANQRIECVNAAADRNVHLLTRQLSSRPGTLELRVRIGRADGPTLAGKGSAGFRIGILGTLKDYPELHDYRNNLWPGPNAGFNAGFAEFFNNAENPTTTTRTTMQISALAGPQFLVELTVIAAKYRLHSAIRGAVAAMRRPFSVIPARVPAWALRKGSCPCRCASAA